MTLVPLKLIKTELWLNFYYDKNLYVFKYNSLLFLNNYFLFISPINGEKKLYIPHKDFREEIFLIYREEILISH